MTVPIMQVRHDSNDQWWVAAKWPDGAIEDIRGFKSENEANEWISNELETWLAGRKEKHA